MGLQFENLVLNNKKRIWDKLNILPEDIVAGNPFFQRKTTTAPSCQIDYLIQTRFNTLFACEIKFSQTQTKADIIREVQQKLSNLALPRRFSCWPVLIHANGVDEAVTDAGYFTKIINFAEFLEDN